jgi:hypothetical protein
VEPGRGALPALLLLAALLAGCGAGGDVEADGDGLEAWLRPYAEAAAAEAGGWPDLDVDVGVATVQEESRLRRFVPACPAGPVTVRPDSIGPLRAGQTLAELSARCPRLLRGWDWGFGGRAIPAVAVSLGGSIVVALLTDTLPDSHVGQLATGDLSTPEGFGAGSPIEDLIDALGAPELVAAECGVELKFAARPGLSFAVEPPPGAPLDCAEIDAAVRENSADRLPPGTVVRYILQFREG